MPPHGQLAFRRPPETQYTFPTSILRRPLQHAQDSIGCLEYAVGGVPLLFGPSREVHERPLVPRGQIPLLP
jgi:hypothetical protein